MFDDTIMSRFKAALTSGSGHSQRRTKSESDVKRVPPPEAKRVKLEKQSSKSSRSSSFDEEPPNSREPPEVRCTLSLSLSFSSEFSIIIAAFSLPSIVLG